MIRTFRYFTLLFILLYAALIFTGEKRFVWWLQVMEPHRHLFSKKVWLEQDAIMSRPIYKKFGHLQESELQDSADKFDISLADIKEKFVEKLVIQEAPYKMEFDFVSFVHLPRKKLTEPLILMAYNMGWNPHQVFSVFCLFSFLFIAYLNATVAHRLWAVSTLTTFCGFSLFYLLLSVPMNGRMIFSLLAGSIAAFWLVRARQDWKSLVALFGVLLFASISSGVLSVAFTVAVLWTIGLFVQKRDSSKMAWLFLVLHVALLALFFPTFSGGIEKNLEYYGGGFTGLIGMLSHGMGKYLTSIWMPVGLAVLILAWKLNQEFIAKKVGHITLLGLLLASLLGGVFGYSTMTLGIPAFAILAFGRLLDLRMRYFKHEEVSSQPSL